MTGQEFLSCLNSPRAEELLSLLYSQEGLEAARLRYRCLIEELLNESIFPRQEFPEADGDIRVFSVPGRTELGGNHTDHNRGKVLAASIHLDAVALVAPRQDMQVFFRSSGHPDIKVDISDLSLRNEEKGKTEALIRGIAAEFVAQGTPVGAFTANASNLVLPGSGLSSSAAVEVLIAKIFDNLYCAGKRSALELAKIGQKAENVYFGKPCGLMDQTACASGGAVAIDFKDPVNPNITNISFNPVNFALCIVDSKGSHSDLTADYAAIPNEMKALAAFFGKTVLGELDEEMFLSSLVELRKAVGDRAILRGLHFFDENRRVDAMLAALEGVNTSQPDGKTPDNINIMEAFLALVRESGDSSWELLQNIYSNKNPHEQGLTLALAMTKKFLRQESGCAGACRVHGGGFAGTIQAYIPYNKLEEYRNHMEGIFGKGALTVLRIRPWGAMELNFSNKTQREGLTDPFLRA